MPQHELDVHKQSKCALQWSGITKTVKIAQDKSGLVHSSIGKNTNEANNLNKESTSPTKTILNNVSGSALPGEVLALMGPSGSGKTSLLDTLSGRSLFEEGILSVNGINIDHAMMKKFKRKIAYVKQADIFFGHLTVRDQLTYTALLRLPSHFQNTEKHDEVTRIINLLHLQKCADSPIRFLSGGEKKRVNIGTELLTDPHVIILDEPTSGLDSTSAVALIRIIQNLARNEWKTIITSIHQPNSAVFLTFDKLMMLAEGNVVYFGTPKSGMKYLSEKGMECPQGYNVADHWMDVLVVDDSMKKNDTKKSYNGIFEEEELDDNTESRYGFRDFLIKSWDDEIHASETMAYIRSDSVSFSELSFEKIIGRKYNSAWWSQFMILLHRAMRNSRCVIFTPLNIIKAGFMGFFMGMVWFQLKYTEANVKDINGYLFFTMSFWVLDGTVQALLSFPAERAVIYKERASGSYYLSAYVLAKSISEAPTRVALPLIYLTVSYWMVGVKPNFFSFVQTSICLLLSVLTGESYGLVIGASVMDFEKGLVINIVFTTSLMILGGFYVNEVPGFMTGLKFLSPIKYAFDASRLIVFDKKIPCDGSGILELCQSSEEGYILPTDMKEILGVQGSIGFNIAMIIVLLLVARYISYLCLSKKKMIERL